jgi:hypothetical protein
MSQYQEYAEKPTEFLALTGYTQQEFAALLPHFRDSYYQRMSIYRLDGKPRGKRKHSDYQNCPLPLMEDKLQGCTVLKTLKIKVSYGNVKG